MWVCENIRCSYNATSMHVQALQSCPQCHEKLHWVKSRPGMTVEQVDNLRCGDIIMDQDKSLIQTVYSNRDGEVEELLLLYPSGQAFRKKRDRLLKACRLVYSQAKKQEKEEEETMAQVTFRIDKVANGFVVNVKDYEAEEGKFIAPTNTEVQRITGRVVKNLLETEKAKPVEKQKSKTLID